MANHVPPPLPLRSDVSGQRAWLGDVATGVLNAAVGDYLEDSGNALGMGMRVRLGQVYLDESSSPLAWEQGKAHLRPHLCVFIHGLGATEWSWSLGSHAYYGSPDVSLEHRGVRLLGRLCRTHPLQYGVCDRRKMAKNWPRCSSACVRAQR